MSCDTDKWYVLLTKPRKEIKVVESLAREGYNVYCPIHKVRRQWSDRIKIVEEPLFRSYVFIQIEDAKRNEVFACSGTLRYLFWQGRPAVVRQSEIAAIQNWLGKHGNKQIDIAQIMPGDYLKITSGPLFGKEAILLDQRNSKVIVQLKELGIQLSLSLSNNDIMAL